MPEVPDFDFSDLTGVDAAGPGFHFPSPPAMKRTVTINLPAYPKSTNPGPTLTIVQETKGLDGEVTVNVTGAVDDPEAYASIIKLITHLL